ncbi:hypothetical protein TPA0910_10690 [Streptomyces hygroscopicus subsp. sporocinereus]|uniref:Uncharacterized protein n=1 Tax=Streptomyces hygroscopicus TaxID=1912 RepID=A0ABQ3TTH0_STRHY|nr:hypothetical protein TPA0910_10690 [Streptomyces hygroscopicus]
MLRLKVEHLSKDHPGPGPPGGQLHSFRAAKELDAILARLKKNPVPFWPNPAKTRERDAPAGAGALVRRPCPPVRGRPAREPERTRAGGRALGPGERTPTVFLSRSGRCVAAAVSAPVGAPVPRRDDLSWPPGR